MSNSRQIHFDIEALLLSGLCLFLWLSLASYDPADAVAKAPGRLRPPQRSTRKSIQSMCSLPIIVAGSGATCRKIDDSEPWSRLHPGGYWNVGIGNLDVPSAKQLRACFATNRMGAGDSVGDYLGIAARLAHSTGTCNWSWRLSRHNHVDVAQCEFCIGR